MSPSAPAAAVPRNVRKNVLINFVSRAAVMLTAFIQIPFLYRALGQSGFVLWQWLMLAGQVVIMLEIGVSFSLLNRFSRLLARGHLPRVAEAHGASKGSLLLISGILMALGAVFISFAPLSLLGGATDPGSGMRTAAFWVFFLQAGSLPLLSSVRLVQANQFSWIQQLSQAIASVSAFTGIVCLAGRYPSLPLLAGIGASGPLITGLLCHAAARAFLRPQLGETKLRLRLLRAHIRRGRWFALSGVAGTAMPFASQSLMNAYGGLQTATGFALLQRLGNAVLSVNQTVTSPLWPTITQAHLTGRFEWLRTVFRRIMLWTGALSGGFLLVTFIGRGTLLRTWTRSSELSLTPALALCTGLAIGGTAFYQSYSVILNALGRQAAVAYGGAFGCMITLAVAFLIALSGWDAGIPLGVALGSAAACFYMHRLVRTEFRR